MFAKLCYNSRGFETILLAVTWLVNGWLSSAHANWKSKIDSSIGVSAVHWPTSWWLLAAPERERLH